MLMRNRLFGGAAVSVLFWSLGAAAYAQDTSSEDEIVVTASRVARSGFDAPTPTRVLNAEALEERGLSNVGEFLSEIPAFRASQTVQTNPQNSQGAGQNYADLRGLGNIRTLTLVDGRRHVPSSATGQVDLNLVPTLMVDRVDVVTGGASAAWGSDAVSGVVNVILNNRLDGFKGDTSYGIAEEGDNQEQRLSFGMGTPFQEGRGHIVFGYEYVESEGVDGYEDRGWGRRQSELVSYTGARPAGAPSRFYADGVQALNMAYGGVIIGVNADTNAGNGVDALRGIQFGPGGTVIPFDYGTMVGASSINFTGGNAGLYARDGHQLIIPVERNVAMVHLTYDLTSNLTLFVEGGYGRSAADFRTPPNRDTTTASIVIQRDNAFLPAAVGAIMDTNGITSFPMGRANNDFGETRASNVNTTERFAIGLRGDLGGSWDWDAYYTYGRNTFDSTLSNHRIQSNFRAAYDAIEVGGVVVCRDPVARAQGCVPLNLFGQGSPSAAAIDWVTGTQFHTIVTEQSVVAANVRGEPFSTWAGVVSIAAGAERREETAEAVSDPIAASRGFVYGNPLPFAGSYDVTEGYVEAVVPLARDLPFMQSFDVNGAIRYADYSTSGGVTTWKAGATWEVFNDLRLRGTVSRDIRAPNNSEIFASTTNNNTLRNPFSGATGQIIVINQSSPTLQPEEADTITYGFVYSPSFVPGLRFSVDYYDIEISGAIAGYSPQLILDNCANEIAGSGAGFFCGFVDRAGTGAATIINTVRVDLLNIASLSTQGVDFEVSYDFGLLGADWTARLFGTYTDNLISDDGLGTPRTYNGAGVLQNVGSVVDRAGQVGGFTSGANVGATNVPHWVLNGSLTYSRGPFSTTVQGRYVDGGTVDNTLVGPDSPEYNPASPISIASNKVDSRFYVNLLASYNLFEEGGRRAQIYGLINNVGDVDPPFPATALSGLYDRVGRSYKVGFRFTY